jgi:sortase A
MVRQTRRSRTPADPEALALLQNLLDDSLAPTRLRRAPVALRSAGEQRKLALNGYKFRTWFDSALGLTERLLALVAVAIFGYWLYEGPIHDYLYQPPVVSARAGSAAQTQAPGAPRTAPTETTASLMAAPLPYITDADPERDNDFIAPRSAPAAPQPATDTAPTRLQIPALSLDTPVREVFVVDGEWQVAEYAAGFMHGTAPPGEPGTTALAGHAGLRGAVFRDLPSLQPGDDVWLDAGGWRYRYRVRESFSVWPTDTSVLAPSQASTLVLITCTNWDTQRLIVRADLIESKPETS